MKPDEHIINHGGKFYVGTVSDYMRLCTSDSQSTGLREATPADIQLYAFRRKEQEWKNKLAKQMEMPKGCAHEAR